MRVRSPALADIRSYNDKTDSETHDTFKCKRCRDGKQILKSKAMLYGDTSTCVNAPSWV